MCECIPVNRFYCFLYYGAVNDACVQILEYIKAWKSYLFFCLLYHLIIIIMQAFLKALNIYNSFQVYSVECVSKIKSKLSIAFHAIYVAVRFEY